MDLDSSLIWQQLKSKTESLNKITLIKNKIDLTCQTVAFYEKNETGLPCVLISVLKQQGLDLLTTHLKQAVGFMNTEEGGFIARRRHLDALKRAQLAVQTAYQQLTRHHAGELLAEDLRQAQQALSEITGEFSSDALLGEIFSSFCIGK